MILLLVLLLLLIGTTPRWGYSRGWGYYPSGTISLIFILLIIMMMLGRF